ncbi:MAG TPA: ribonuclease D, partial [Candidatus Saccharimonadales bacterium]|nr:ribonuclease D [Candidatus Saccharimonadales bacterium]
MRAKRPWEWIDTPEGLARLVEAIEGESIIGLDTESDSFHHYQEQVCLIQAAVGENDYLLDTLALRDLSSLRGPLGDPKREVVINGADYDIVCLKRDFGIRFGKIFDTALGAQLLGYPATGLSALLARHFNVKVSKQLQRDEWFRRPLNEAQMTYALNDIRYLIPLRGKIRDELEELGRLEWAEEEFHLLTKREWNRGPFQPDGFWRIRGSRDIGRREQAILRELAVMRDARARAINRPPFKVISDQALKDIAHARVRSTRGLRKIRGVSDLMIRRFGEEILAAVGKGLEVPEKDLPVPPRGERRPGDPAASRRLELLKRWRRDRAVAFKLDPGVLAPLSTLKAVARSGASTLKELQKTAEVSRWRIREFGREWLE